ncbi:ABC transporter ATP-binding protein/permease [Christensenellaceae bacterium OttesenSCG-928-M15]|nr:ABC transporter ATP-binding protein/permease [Christensenellaceae bacterium OttesenSCG-928-M15]
MITIFKKFFQFAGEQKKNFYISLLYAFLLAMFEALRIPAIAVILTALVKGSMTVNTILTSLGIMLLSIAGSALMRNRTVIRQTVGGYTMCAQKRVEIGERLKYMPMGYFNEHNLGHITSITTNTAENLQDVATRVIQMYLQGVINTTVITLALLVFDWRVGLVTAAGILLFALVNGGMQRASKRVSPQKNAADEKIVDAVLEYVQGIGVVKSYNLEKQANQKVDQAIDECERVNFSLEKTFVPIQGLQTVVLKLAGVGMTLAAIALYTSGALALESCLLLVICSFMVYAHLETAGVYSALLRIVDLSIDKMEGIFKSPVMDENGEDIYPKNCDIEGKHVSFSYDRKTILDDVNFTIRQNTTTAIVGPSGGGKTTLCNLIARFWDVDEGSITLGGRDVREYKLDKLLTSVSMVFQNVYLFNDTVINNIRFGKPEATKEQVIEAAKKACCHEFIMRLPEGYDTMVGEGGATLSGGEKQRVSIARAILKDAPIIILDEATANVDPENEKHLQAAIAALTKNKTIIMIAHRLKTVRNAGQILVVADGKIVERGTHKELMVKNGMYADFINMREQAVGWKLGRKAV